MTLNLYHAVAFLFILVGLSHILHPRRWSDFFIELFKTAAPSFVISAFTLPLGLVIVCTHNVWRRDLSLILTIYGWAAVFKGSLYALAPSFVHGFVTNKIKRPAHFAYGGFVLLILGGLLMYHAVTSAPI